MYRVFSHRVWIVWEVCLGDWEGGAQPLTQREAAPDSKRAQIDTRMRYCFCGMYGAPQ